jgi:hypothetical protein
MNRKISPITKLLSIRNRYGNEYLAQKLHLLSAIGRQKVYSKKETGVLYHCLLFLLAYPDSRKIRLQAFELLQQLETFIHSNEHIRNSLYNSGITKTKVCASYSFELVKWLRASHPETIRLASWDANDSALQSIISVVMPKVESEILQDANADWKTWLTLSLKKGETLLDRFIKLFDETDIRPEVKDELWNALGLNVEIDFPVHHELPDSLVKPFYHPSLLKKSRSKTAVVKSVKLKLNNEEANSILECSRMILVRHLREIDPITFSSPELVDYYQLPRGISVALVGMTPQRRHPVDSYMGYVAFKNGLPVAYAGSWILFDSGRIGLNVFPAYRGGESQYIFEQILKLHRQVYKLNRFSVDPYQLGKENHDGIHSGAFWVYYRAGFRPVKKEQQLLAAAESEKINKNKNYRSPHAVLKKLSDSRMEMVLKTKAVRFDATDLSMAYASIVKKRFGNNRKQAEEILFVKLARRLQIKNFQEEKMKFVLKNWALLLMSCEKEWKDNKPLKTGLKKCFEEKAYGKEEKYISRLQHLPAFRKLVENVLLRN